MEDKNKNKGTISTADLADAGRSETHVRASQGTTPELAAPRRTEGASVPVRKTNEEKTTEPLFSPAEAGTLRTRWESIQVGFVDEPRSSVQQADQLVAEAIKHLAEGFADEREKLEKQWDRGDSVSTEDLRLSLRRYRSFFERLVTI